MDEEEDSACELRSCGTSVTPDRLSDRKWQRLGMYSGISSPASSNDPRWTGASRPDSAIELHGSRQQSACDIRSDSCLASYRPNNSHVATGTDDHEDDEESDDQLSCDTPLPDFEEPEADVEERIVARHVSYHDHDCSRSHRSCNWPKSQDSPEQHGSDDEYILKQIPIQQAASMVQVQMVEPLVETDVDVSTNVDIHDETNEDLSQFRSRLSNLLDRSNRHRIHDPLSIDRTIDAPISNQSIEPSNASTVDLNVASLSNPIVTLSEEEFAQRTSALRQRIHNTFQLLCSIGAADGSELRKLAASRAQSRAQSESIEESANDQESRSSNVPTEPLCSQPQSSLDHDQKHPQLSASSAQPSPSATQLNHHHSSQSHSRYRNPSIVTETSGHLENGDVLEIDTFDDVTNNERITSNTWHPLPQSAPPPASSFDCQLLPPHCSDLDMDCAGEGRPSIDSAKITSRKPPRPPMSAPLPPPPPPPKQPEPHSSATVRRTSANRSAFASDLPTASIRHKPTQSGSVCTLKANSLQSTSGWIDQHQHLQPLHQHLHHQHLHPHLLHPDRHLHQRYVHSKSPTEYTDSYERHEYTYQPVHCRSNSMMNVAAGCCSRPTQHNRAQQTVLDGPAMRKLLVPLQSQQSSVHTQTDTPTSTSGSIRNEPIFRRLRDVGVSTDRFTRARFSSLPATRARYVQTTPQEFQRTISTAVSADELPSDQLVMRRQRLMKLRELASNKVNKASQTDELQKSFSTLAAEECNKCVQLEAELKRTLSPQLLHNTMKQVLVDSKLTLDQLIQVMQQNESKSLAEKSESESSNDESNEEDPKSDDKEIEMLHHETNLNQPTVEIDCGQKSSIVNIVKEDKSVQVNLRPIEKDSLVESDAKKPTEADDQIKNPINMSLDFCIQCDLDSTAKHEQTNDQVHQLDQKFEDKSNEDVPFDPHSSSSHIESGERSEEAGLSNKKDEEKSTGDEPARSGERELISHRQVIPDQRAQRMKTESSISIQVNGRNHRETAQFKCETRMNRLGAFSRKAELTNTRQIPILVPNLSIAPVSTPAAIAGDIDSEAANEHIKRTALNRQKSVSAQNLSTDSGGSTSGYVRSQTPAFSESELELTGMRSTSRNSLTTDWCQAEQQQSIEIVAPAGQRRSRQIQDESVPKIGRPNAAQRMSWYEESSSNVTSEISADPLRDSGGRTHVPRSVQMKSAASLVVGNGRLGGGGLNCASKVQRQFESDAVTEPIMESNVTLHEPKPVYQSRVAAWSANESQVSSGEAPSAVLDEFDETNSMPDTSEPFEHSDSQSPKLKQQSRLPSTSVQQKSDRSSPRINETSDYSSLAGINTSNSINDEPPSMTKTLTKRQACKNDVKLNVDQPVYSRPRPAERSRDGGSKPGSRVGFYLPNEPDPISYPQKEHDSKSHTRQSQRPSAETSLDQNSNQNNAAKVLETQLDDVCGNYWQPPPHDRSSTPVSRVEPDTATPVQHEIRMMDTVTGQGSRERSLYRAHRPTSFHPNDQSSGDPIETENRRAELESPLEQTLKLNEQPDGTEIVTNITKTSFPVLRKSTGRFGCSRQTTTNESSTCGCTNRTSGSAVRAERSTCGSRCRSRSRSHYTEPEDRPLSVSNSNLTNLFKRNRLVFEQLLRTPEPRSANQAAACANDSVHSGRPTESNCAGCRIDSQITMDLPIPRQRNASNCKRTSGSSCASTTSTGGRARRAPVTGSMDDLDRKSLASSHSHSQLSGQFVTSSHFRRTRPTTNASLNRAMSSSQQMLSAAGLRASETDWQYTMQCKCTNSSNANVLTNVGHRRMLYLPLTQYETSL